MKTETSKRARTEMRNSGPALRTSAELGLTPNVVSRDNATSVPLGCIGHVAEVNGEDAQISPGLAGDGEPERLATGFQGESMYQVIYADPPWAYRNRKTGGSHTSGSAQKYPTLTLAEIHALPLGELGHQNSVCFLWATTPLGRDPFDVLDQWGYVYKTKWYWRKTGRKGTGYWTRGCVEEVLIGVRGTVPAWRSDLDNWIEELDYVVESRREGHSRKPALVRQMIELLTPGARRFELFATERSVGWDVYGLALDPTHDFRLSTFWEGLLGHHPDVSLEVRRRLRRAQVSRKRVSVAD